MWRKFLGAICAVLLFGSCGGSGPSVSPLASTAPPTPGPLATSSPEPVSWTYVVFGDSVMWGLQNAYAEALEKALGVEVVVLDRTRGGGTAEDLLLLLQAEGRGYDKLHEEIATADVITVEVPVHEFELECGMDETTVAGTRACMTRARERIVGAAEGIIARIAELRSPDEALIRVIVDHLFFYGIHLGQGTADEAWAQWRAMNTAIAGIAARHRIQVVSLFDALQAPDGKTDPGVGGLVSDGIHLTEAGIEVAVRALIDSGLEDAPASTR